MSAHGEPPTAPDFAKMDGLLPCVTVHALTGEVLTVAYVNEDALRATRESGLMHYWSRSRKKLWQKGEESGNVQRVDSIALDCDGDALLARVHPEGPACHTGTPSCFTTSLLGEHAPPTLTALERVLEDRAAHPREGSWTTTLLTDENKRLKKVVEEAGEVVMAAKDHDKKHLAEEIADVIYHALVAGVAEGVTPTDVLRVLSERRK